MMTVMTNLRVGQGTNLGIDVHLALSSGGTLPTQTGAYLRDSFREKVLIPAFNGLDEKMKLRDMAESEQNRTLTIFGVISSLMQILQVMYIMALKKKINKQGNNVRAGE